MAYDPIRGRTVLHGGYTGGSGLADTWEWDGVDWTLRTPGTAPPAQQHHTMGFDLALGQVVMLVRENPVPYTSRLWAWSGDHRGDCFKNFETGLASTKNGFFYDVPGKAGGFRVHLNRGDAVMGPCDFEVHTTISILEILEICDHLVFPSGFIARKTHRDSRNRGTNRNARVHKGER
jgi:hypothetical protein